MENFEIKKTGTTLESLDSDIAKAVISTKGVIKTHEIKEPKITITVLIEYEK